MGKALLALSFAAGLGTLCSHAANAAPADSQAVREAAKASSPLKVQYEERRTRYGVVKCYRTLVVGRYRCHRFY
jgi:hypothetical protein